MAVEEISELVKNTRRTVGMSQAALARAAGTSRQYISGIERGEWTPSPAQARAIALALGLPAGALGGSGAATGGALRGGGALFQ